MKQVVHPSPYTPQYQVTECGTEKQTACTTI